MSLLARFAAAFATVLIAAASARALPPANACTCPPNEAAQPRTIDLNTANERTLLELPGIGPSRARAILAYREAHGAFRSLSQLMQIKGIGRSLLRQLRPLVTLSATQP